ncbi:helix-turn-helix transcriptional regulator [Caenimonas sedimenti]|uniref:Helix-turn-helix transcriptional regulator n=1 Tax=Caenimonas sedimenti TaxID=2596921 RepID=A0A562ZXC7_9BURK|nr:helix-turn-helix transcriptional regulator [Caenimonas sedimenti]TWO72978.1 helix-turn-helix transcriptional regulator [Caenimonas sedimenti]
MSGREIAYSWGRRLKQARLAAGLSQRQLGIQAGIDEAVASTRINRYELDIHQPDVRIAHALARVLGVSAAFFYAAEEELAEYIFRLAQLRAAERRDTYRSLAHIPGPPAA